MTTCEHVWGERGDDPELQCINCGFKPLSALAAAQATIATLEQTIAEQQGEIDELKQVIQEVTGAIDMGIVPLREATARLTAENEQWQQRYNLLAGMAGDIVAKSANPPPISMDAALAKENARLTERVGALEGALREYKKLHCAEGDCFDCSYRARCPMCNDTALSGADVPNYREALEVEFVKAAKYLAMLTEQGTISWNMRDPNKDSTTPEWDAPADLVRAFQRLEGRPEEVSEL